MAAAPGITDGSFAQRGETEFPVLSLWQTAADHGDYHDLETVSGDLFALEAAWTVDGRAPAG